MIDGKSHKVKQIHYTGWPDHGLPTGTSIEDFTLMLNELIDMLLNSEASEKAIIHCSAGIGRTGTTIALAHLLINICSQLNQGV
jgi:protein tyrosine phosphatase